VSFVFVGLFVLGLVAAVRVMLYGVERQRPSGDDGPRSFSASPAVIASFSVIAGMVGYVAVSAGLRPAVTWTIALLAGAASAFGTSRAVSRWWRVVPEHDVDDERYALQGSLARVVADIGERGQGTVTLQGVSPERLLPARTIDDQAIARGTEVVIERIENGVAFVEDWAEVEKRL
jgi:membrane protein implicated in regulation of membrane protease activity